jgi:hypothetical protein
VADKDKDKNIIIDSPRTSEISQGVIIQLASDSRTNKTKGAGGKRDQPTNQSSLVPCIANGPAHAWKSPRGGGGGNRPKIKFIK